eukprot:3305488-Alexandrium_andersonii.AAC.1
MAVSMVQTIAQLVIKAALPGYWAVGSASDPAPLTAGIRYSVRVGAPTVSAAFSQLHDFTTAGRGSVA